MQKNYLYPIIAALSLAAMIALTCLWDFNIEFPETKPSHHNEAEKQGPSQQTIASIQQSISQREYNISFDDLKKSLQSPNRQHNLRAYYKPGTLTIKNRIDSARQNFELRLANEGVFADGKLMYKAQMNAETETLDNKLLIKHSGFQEEFINNEEGIRQNFIIENAPADSKELTVKLSAQGMQVKDLENNELNFFTKNENGQTVKELSYKDLKCWDANGAILESSMSLENDLIVINVIVDDATYPITIDPLVTQGNPSNAKATLEGDQAGAWMGSSGGSAGDVNGDGYSDVLVAASKFDNGQVDEGIVFLYYGNASGINVATPVMLECDQKEARFGAFVSSAGDINKDGFSDIVIGAHMYDKGQSNEGAAFIYLGSAQGINKVASQILESNQAEANMGNTVGLAGDVNGDGYSDVLVCARAYDNGQTNEGIVFLYHGSSAGLSANPVLIEQNQSESMFGFAASGAGDVNGDGYSDIVVGARLYDKGETDEGAVFVYHGSAAGINSNSPAATLESNQANAYLGHTVNTAGDVNGDGYSDVIAGANMYDKGQLNEGAAFVHYGSAAGIGAQAAVVLEKNQAEAQLGSSVASAGDANGDGYADVIVGAMFYDNGQSNEGAAFVYQGSAIGLSTIPVSKFESEQANAQLGNSVASAGDINGDGYSDVLMGSIAYDKGQVDEGAAFIWYGEAGGISSIPFKLEGSNPFAQMGWSIAHVGDVNGDGYDDVGIAADGYDNGQTSEGAVFIYHGSQLGLNPMPVTTIEGNQKYARMGSIASAGDVNGDGYGDIIIGVPLYGENNAGAVFIYHGSSQGIISNVEYKIEQQQIEDGRFGNSVASAGDVNGDGYGDVVVGAPEFEEGMAFVYLGSSNGIITNMITEIDGSTDGFLMGVVTGLGDVNGDSFDDVAIGSPFYSKEEAYEGAIMIHYGSSTGISANPDLILQANKTEVRLGSSVSEAGDINGDGYMDLIAGASHFASGQYVEGALYVYYGSTLGLNATPTIIESNIENSYFGSSVSAAGDINGDGYSDILVGAVGYSNGQPNEGAVFIYQGSESGLNLGYSAKQEGNQESAFLGNSVSGGGDINGDGFSDIMMGAHQYDNGQINEGMVYIHYGNSNGTNLRNNPRLYNTNLTTSINQAQLAKNNFGAGLFIKSFIGRSKGCLFWETKPKNQGFSRGTDNSITTSTQFSGKGLFADLGTMGTELKSLINKQGSSTKVRVRVKYNPTTALTGQVFGPWRYIPAYLAGASIAPVPEDVTARHLQMTEKRLSSISDEQEIGIYPNPVSDKLIIDINDENEMKNARLLTTVGMLVLTTTQNIVDVSNLAPGMYILVITYKNDQQTSRKVIVNR
ncbi:FG-GAP-like repeat-containing protein [Dyadobacter sp. CY343]|uniref:FG-GAP-like repeat-containing protein n=1 Tax=Dyadobacter sp. CY343 TaxID=2907299 RepID=UPI001F1D391D|nr:FG-GAP-like repeat-containing protein [Dyadobacter sp. CY343]MCE7058539.1 FG-GAP-like repeat-containing protein [Dyadobacter sp. CY343]